MDDDEFLVLVQNLRRFGGDLADVEVKRAHGKLPKSTHETLSAFANKEGGVLILGLDEKSGFEAVGVKDVAKLVADLGSLCSDFEPPIRAAITTRRFRDSGSRRRGGPGDASGGQAVPSQSDGDLPG